MAAGGEFDSAGFCREAKMKLTDIKQREGAEREQERNKRKEKLSLNIEALLIYIIAVFFIIIVLFTLNIGNKFHTLMHTQMQYVCCHNVNFSYC